MPILIDKLFSISSLNINNKLVNNIVTKLLNASEKNISFDAIICYFFIRVDHLIKDNLNSKLYLYNYYFPNHYINIIENYNNINNSQNRIKNEIQRINELNELTNFDDNTKENFLNNLKENIQKINTEEFINKLGRC